MFYIYSMIIVDGSKKSGSGTILRYAVAIGALLQQQVKVFNVRAQRNNPGLRPQHLAAIRAVAELTDGSIEGGEVGSSEFVFTPGKKVNGGSYTWDIGTAGSTTMLVMTVLPAALIIRDKLQCRITGGLFQDFAPSFFHMQQVLGPILWKMGVTMRVNMIRPGYVPAGNGILEIEIDPVRKPLQPLTLTDQGDIESVEGTAISSHLQDRFFAAKFYRRKVTKSISGKSTKIPHYNRVLCWLCLPGHRPVVFSVPTVQVRREDGPKL